MRRFHAMPYQLRNGGQRGNKGARKKGDRFFFFIFIVIVSAGLSKCLEERGSMEPIQLPGFTLRTATAADAAELIRLIKALATYEKEADKVLFCAIHHTIALCFSTPNSTFNRRF